MEYKNRDENGYLSDAELEKLIADTEEGSLFQAPDYLEKIILDKAKHQAFRDSVEIMPICNTIRDSLRENQTSSVEKKPAEPDRQKKSGGTLQLITYSVKIVAAAAAAIAFLTVVPAMQNPSAGSREDAVHTEYEERHSKQQEAKKEKSLARSLNEWTSDWCNSLFEGTNRILMREDK